MSEEQAVETSAAVTPATAEAAPAEKIEKIENFDDYLPDNDMAMSERKAEPKADPEPAKETEENPADTEESVEETGEESAADTGDKNTITLPLEKYEELLAKRQEQADVAPEKAAEPKAPESKPVTLPEFSISPEEADAMGLIDAAPLVSKINEHIAGLMENISKNLEQQPFIRMAEQFLDANIEWEPYPHIVNEALAFVLKETPGILPRAALAKTKERLAAYNLKATKIAKSQKIDVSKPGKPGTAPGTQSRKDGGLATPKYNATTKSLMSIGDNEIPDFFND
jgi:hypothetical protein